MKVDRFESFSSKLKMNENKAVRDPSMFDYTEKFKGKGQDAEMTTVTAIAKDYENLNDFQIELMNTIDDMAEQYYIIEEISNMAKGKGEYLKGELRGLPAQFFDEIDDLATKNLETKKFAITISKRGEEVETFNYRKAYEYIIENANITKEILKEVKEQFTSMSAPRASTIKVKPKLIEISDKISNYLEGVKGALERGELTTHKAEDIIMQPKSSDSDDNGWIDFINRESKPSQADESEWADFIRRNKLEESKIFDTLRRGWRNFLSWIGVNLNTMENNLEVLRGMMEQANKYGRKRMEF